ncbi:MAG: type IV secretory system conjugative DNA transfer family protein [Candidatus Saccharimonadales bacterium]
MKTAQLHSYLTLLPWVVFIGLVVILIVMLIKFGVRFHSWRQLLSRKMVFLELTPPAFTTRTPIATQQLFSIIHGQRAARSFRDKLFGRHVTLALELVASRETGIRYLVQVEERLSAGLQQAVTSYLPDVKVKAVSDYISDKPSKNSRILDFKQTGHYAFALATHASLEEHDPVAYLTGAMTKLESDETMSLQLVLTPVKLKEAADLSHKILGNEDLLSHLSGRSLPLVSKLTGLINSLLFSATDLVGEVYHGATNQSFNSSQKDAHDKLQIAKRLRPARTLSAFELELMESIHRKVSQPLFRVSLRARVNIDDKQAAKERIGMIKSSLESYSSASYQAFKSKPTLPFISKYRQFVFRNRLPALLSKRDCILSASEIASIYHFPIGTVSKTDNLVTSLSRTLAAPLSLKQNTSFDLTLGRNYHHGTETSIGLSEAERERHIYIIGGTGNGKTTMLQFGIVQDMHSGKGLAVVDPHGDMAETLLKHVPENRINDVIYFNPDDIGYPIGLNLLELPEGVSGDELLREKDLITESVISVFRKIFSEEDTGGHRIEYVLRNTIQTALTTPDATLFTVFDLLNDPKYRKKVIKTLENKDLINFWKNELGKAGEMQRVKMAAGITAKIGRFLFSASAKRILEQPKSTIDFDDIINSGKILICNFSKGLLGEDTSELFGITVLAKLQLASLRRARIQQSERRPFYLYVDEFQNFATASFVQMLSEARKYRLFMTMAEQSTSQQKDQQMVSIILANVGTVICFRTGNPADEKVLLPLFSPFIEMGEISNLPSFNFYVKVSTVQAQEPFSGQTLLLANEGSSEIASQVIENSRNNSATQHVEVSDDTFMNTNELPKPVTAPQKMLDMT